MTLYILVVIAGASPESIEGAVVEVLAEASPAQIFILGRSEPKGKSTIAVFKRVRAAVQPVLPPTELHFVPCDLADLQSVREAASTVRAKAKGGKVHVLFNNAGVHLIYPYKRTAQGFEYHFGLNHYAHFALTVELCSLLKAAGKDAVVVTTSSSGCQMSPMLWDQIESMPQWGGGGTYQPWLGYTISKLANSLFNVGLAKRITEADLKIRTFAVQPGQLRTHLWDGVTTEGPTSLIEAFRIGERGLWRTMTVWKCSCPGRDTTNNCQCHRTRRQSSKLPARLLLLLSILNFIVGAKTIFQARETGC